jgi:hypothetical protein
VVLVAPVAAALVQTSVQEQVQTEQMVRPTPVVVAVAHLVLILEL